MENTIGSPRVDESRNDFSLEEEMMEPNNRMPNAARLQKADSKKNSNSWGNADAGVDNGLIDDMELGEDKTIDPITKDYGSTTNSTQRGSAASSAGHRAGGDSSDASLSSNISNSNRYLLKKNEGKPRHMPDSKLRGKNDKPFGGYIERSPFEWLRGLTEVFGWKLMVMLFCAQHLCKGLIASLTGAPVQFIYKEYHVSGPQIQVFSGAAGLPWAMKPIMGLFSDALPMGGYRKMGYVLMALLVGVISCICISTSSAETFPVEGIVACLFGLQLFLSNVDLLSEAAYAEGIKEQPKHGPDMMSYVWGGMHICSLGAIIMSPMLMKIGLRIPYVVALVPIIITMYPTARNFLGEKKMNTEEVKQANQRLFKQPEAFALCIIMFTGTTILSGVGILYRDVMANAIASSVLALFLLVAFCIVFPPTIAKVNAFFLIQTSLGISTGGAVFYFYTDTEKQYPAGPHFSMTFYTGVLGVSGAICSLIGVVLYQRWFRDWTYQRLLIMVNLLFSALCMLDVIFFLRWNVRMGINDHFFVLGAACSESVVGQWMWMPGVVILSQLVQPGMEATMYALLAGCHNLGNTVSSNLGAAVLQYLEIQPRGLDNEGSQFDKLWMASLLSTILPLATCILIPFMLPASKQDEKVDLSDEVSPWSRWFGTPGVTASNSPVSYTQVVAHESDISSEDTTPQNVRKIGGRHHDDDTN